MSQVGHARSVIATLAAAGRTVPMAGASTGITSALLRLDARTRARTLVVEFPAGFSRAESGRYQAGEEFLVLSGALEIAGLNLMAGDWAWIPPRVLRGDFSAPGGAVVYAWFSAGNEWEPSDEPAAGLGIRRATIGLGSVQPVSLRGDLDSDEPGASAVLPPGTDVAGPSELLNLVDLSWTRLEDGERCSTGADAALVRWDQSAGSRAGRGTGG